MAETIPLLISKPDCRMAERIALALAIKGLSSKTSSLTKLNKKDTTHSKYLEMGIPLLLVAKEGACGWVAALDLLEKTKPEPSLFPNNNRGMPIALSFWSEHAAAKASASGDFSPYVELISRQIADGRRFLQGNSPGLADIESYIAVATAAKADLPARVLGWRERMATLKSSVSSQPAAPREAEHRLQTLKNLTVSPVDLDR